MRQSEWQFVGQGFAGFGFLPVGSSELGKSGSFLDLAYSLQK
jgi:hypothetical protein